ncbi:hypothetical protein [Pseudanabaena sp. BC1403]|uniref:hypothetical protein n=1 Tax=Pseudanabaena sp. BC1403 TaxID=2043171 RepID=UPI000CD8E950|nr:hypothetical protein [Pseudanabaena sp. BC1403]
MRQQNNSRQNTNPARQLKQTKVPRGISFLYYSLALTILSVIILIITPFAGSLAFLFFGVVGTIIASVVAQIMAIVGKLFCLTAPERMTGKETIYISVMFDLISIIIACFQGIGAFSPNGAGLQTIISAIAYVSFLIFLKQVAEFIHKNNLAKDAEGVLLIGIGLVVSLGLATIFPFIALLSLLLFLIWVIRYYKLLMNLSEAMQSL